MPETRYYECNTKVQREWQKKEVPYFYKLLEDLCSFLFCLRTDLTGGKGQVIVIEAAVF